MQLHSGFCVMKYRYTVITKLKVNIYFLTIFWRLLPFTVLTRSI